MSSLQFTDCNGLGGFLSLGFVQSGMELQHRTGTLKFGNTLAGNNRHLLGEKWDYNFSDEPSSWSRPKGTDVVIGCPPCSGWSLWSSPADRGVDSKAHDHAKAFMEYVGRVAPKVAVFECVQQAYIDGRHAMLAYRDTVETLSGKKYDLYHVKHNNLKLGGFSYRPRYFWVIVRAGMKFSVSNIDPLSIPRITDVIGDLAQLPQTWEKQSYSNVGKSHSGAVIKHLLSKDNKVDGHIGKTNIHAQRLHDVFEIIGNDGWPGNADLSYALKKAVDARDGVFPDSWIDISPRVIRKDFKLGFSQPYRWKKNSWCNVLTGAALDHVIHPTEPRLITHREAARIQGLPDSWNIELSKDYSQLAAVWGKAVAVQPSRWIADAIKNSIEGGESLGDSGEKIGTREYLIDADKGFSRPYAKKKYFTEVTK